VDFKLIWTERSLEDLHSIVRHYARDEHSPEAAVKVGRAILERVEILQSFPDIGPRYPRPNGVHREVQCFDYRIFYRVDHKVRVVYIARIWHGARDPKSLEL
jgi:plasmid stabilization system protein ParE